MDGCNPIIYIYIYRWWWWFLVYINFFQNQSRCSCNKIPTHSHLCRVYTWPPPTITPTDEATQLLIKFERGKMFLHAKQLLAHSTSSCLRLLFTWMRAAPFLCVFKLPAILTEWLFCLIGLKSHIRQLPSVENQAKGRNKSLRSHQWKETAQLNN